MTVSKNNMNAKEIQRESKKKFNEEKYNQARALSEKNELKISKVRMYVCVSARLSMKNYGKLKNYTKFPLYQSKTTLKL